MRISRVVMSMALVAVVASDALAQNPPAGSPPPPQGRGGGRGGRGAVRAMVLTSPGFTDAAPMPVKYSQAGDEVSPPLAWTGAPDSIRSLVLIVHDLDAASGPTGTDDVLHWMLWNIPGTATSLPEGIQQGPQLSDGTRQISVSGPYYRGPAARAPGPVHHYVFELFALDTMVDVPAVGAPPAATRAAVMTAMAGHVRAKGVMVVLYRMQ